MANQYARAPHAEPLRSASVEAPNAALLIDFDNVTMGMRSDLAKELKGLLDSDIIKGKVTVQRAYADWRRYPQYIVPLSEASIDLIFAPAYGSSKKNATDIRMAIDGMELVFIRPEIGTYILLTGDSDFSSLVLKLKEYGKYVVGIGIQESSSDILVQNCDEYYSYTSIAGLRKTSDLDSVSLDPWECVADAVERMASRGDVMRSDRLKQVMLELSPNFDERNLGFKKFSKFLTEAAGKGLVSVHRSENGQYVVAPVKGRSTSSTDSRMATSSRSTSKSEGDTRSRGRGRSESRGGRSSEGGSRGRGRRDRRDSKDEAVAPTGQAVEKGLETLRETMERLRADGKESVRDSDVKRKILALDPDFNEVPLGFPKFSRFLLHAEGQGLVTLEKLETGNFRVTLAGKPGSSGNGGGPEAGEPSQPAGQERSAGETTFAPSGTGTETSVSALPAEAVGATTDTQESGPAEDGPTEEGKATRGGALGLGRLFGRLGPRRGDRSKRDETAASIAVDPAQTRVPARREETSSVATPTATPPVQSSGEPVRTDQPGGAAKPPSTDGSQAHSTERIDPKALGLPTTTDSMISYLANRYRGVGQITAESLVDRFGADLFTVLQSDPDRVRSLVGDSRAEQVLTAWREDYARRGQSTRRTAAAGARQEG